MHALGGILGAEARRLHSRPIVNNNNPLTHNGECPVTPSYDALRAKISSDLLQVYLRVGLLLLIAVVCARLFAPFAPIILWALVLAITLFPLCRSLQTKLGGGLTRAATAMVIMGLLLIGVPTVLLGISLAGQAADLYSAHQAGTLSLRAPPAGVAQWPVVGEQIDAVWQEAHENLPGLLERHSDTVKVAVKRSLDMATGTLATIGLFLGALIIAGVMMAYSASADRATDRIACTLMGSERGIGLKQLSVATIRSVAMGVVGVAFIQALILGVGFLIANIPAAGVLALITLFVGILQLPALIITIPVVGWLWGMGDGSSLFNTVMTVYLLVGGALDGFLKPMLLGRGVDVPMPVVLIGALGGMFTLGLLGLFLGAVVLSVGYQLFMAWVDGESSAEPTDNSAQTTE